MQIFERFGKLIDMVEEFAKGERKIVRDHAPNAAAAVARGLKGSDLHIHTGKIRYAPAGTSDKPRDHATYSEHVLFHKGKPVGLATVHHAHPSDHGKIHGGGTQGKYNDHSVDIHAPGVHSDAHGILKAKVKEHVNSKEFTSIVSEHNKDKKK
jgi:hypothetical protein